MKILYGINGEGLGHLNRSRLIIEQLKLSGHEVIKVCPQHLKQDDFIPINNINLSFKDGKVDKEKVIIDYIEFNFKNQIKLIHSYGINPDLVITDFEPVTARYARYYDIPILSIDNQHRFRKIDLKLPPRYLSYNIFLSLLLKVFIGRVDKSIVTCFHPIKDACNVICENGKVTDDGSTVVYLKDPYTKIFVKNNLVGDFCVFTNLKYKDTKNIKFYPLDKVSFKDRIRSCHSVISNAGNQIIGECLYYNKAITCVPIKGQTEQEINSFYLKKFGFGVSSNIDSLIINKNTPNINPENGLYQVMRELNEWIK